MIKAFCGTRGSGKTLSMVHETLPWIKKGFRVVSNTPISAKIYKFCSLREIPTYKNIFRLTYNRAIVIRDYQQFFADFVNGHDTIYLLDEASVVISNYSWDKVPNDIYDKFAQVRKYNVHLLYTTQYFKAVAKKLGAQTDTSIECSAIIRLPPNKDIPYDLGTPIVVRQIEYSPEFYQFQSYSLDMEKKYIRSRHFMFWGTLKETFDAYDTKADVRRGL